MSKIMRMCVLVASLMSLFGVMSASAGAVTWVNDGGTNFTATGGPKTFSLGGVPLLCSSSDVTGTMGVSGFVGPVWTAATGTAKYTNCLVGGVPTGIHCNYTLTTVTQAPPVTTGNIDWTCKVYQGGTNICHAHGSTASHFINPPHTRIILTHATLTATSVPPGTCPVPAVTLTQETWTLTSPNPPNITRRP